MQMTWIQQAQQFDNSKEGKEIRRLMRKSLSVKLTQKELSKLESIMRASGGFDEGEIAFMKAYINQ